MTLPLSLTPFERYMVLDDSPSYPMNIICRARFRGVLDHKVFTKTVRMALERQPLLQSHLQKTNSGAYQWVSSGDDLGTVPIVYEEPTDVYPDVDPIDISKEIGFRPTVVQGNDRFDILFHVHHACADGTGGFQSVRDCLLEYARIKGEGKKPPEMPAIDVRMLPGRNRFHLSSWQLLKMAPGLSVGLFGIWQYFTRYPITLAKGKVAATDGPTIRPYPTHHAFLLTGEESAALAKTAVEKEVSVNELMTRDLFIAMQRWRKKHNPGKPNDWLRIMAPVNLRKLADRRLPATNVVSLLFMDYRAKATENPKTLLDAIKFEFSIIQEFNLNLTFVLLLRLLQWIPGALSWLARPRCAKTTAIFTNVGDPFARLNVPRKDGNLIFGDVEMIGGDIIVPFRPHTAVAFAAFKYVRRQGISLNYDHRVMSSNEAKELLDIFQDCLKETVKKAGELNTQERRSTNCHAPANTDD